MFNINFWCNFTKNFMLEAEEEGAVSAGSKSPINYISIGLAVVVFFVLVFFVVNIIKTYKKLSELRTRAETSFMHMEIYMKNRHQLVLKFVSCVKRYANVDTAVLDAIVNARNVAVQTKSRDQKVLAEADLQQKLNKLFSILRKDVSVEHDEAFDDMVASMRTIESQVARTRIAYNEAVNEFNKKMDGFWSRMVSSFFGFEYEEEFNIDATELPSEYHL